MGGLGGAGDADLGLALGAVEPAGGTGDGGREGLKLLDQQVYGQMLNQVGEAGVDYLVSKGAKALLFADVFPQGWAKGENGGRELIVNNKVGGRNANSGTH